VSRLANLLGAFALRATGGVDRALAESAGLGPADPAALVSLLNYAGGENIDTLRRGLRLSQPGSAHAVARLTRLGLVERRRASDDRRAAVVRLTAEGERLARALLRERERVLADLLAPLDASERATLERLLERLLGAAETDVDRARYDCRLCDTVACGHPARCPVTRAARG
jgi:DNA-binding MarR family transcriptional regulator